MNLQKVFSIKNGYIRHSGVFLKQKIITFAGLSFSFPIQRHIRGKNNRVLVKNSNGTIKEIKNGIDEFQIEIEGDNNEILLETPFDFQKSRLYIAGSNNKIIIERVKYIHEAEITIGGDGKNEVRLHIKPDFSVSGGRFFISENTSLEIDEDCMFSWGINIQTCDGHTIKDLNSGEIINIRKEPLCLKIGKHVWVGHDACIHKNASIADNCIVGACSFVTKNFEKPNCIIAGIPAKVVKENIKWER